MTKCQITSTVMQWCGSGTTKFDRSGSSPDGRSMARKSSNWLQNNFNLEISYFFWGVDLKYVISCEKKMFVKLCFSLHFIHLDPDPNSASVMYCLYNICLKYIFVSPADLANTQMKIVSIFSTDPHFKKLSDPDPKKYTDLTRDVCTQGIGY